MIKVCLEFAFKCILRNRLAVIVYCNIVFHYSFRTKTTDLHCIDRYYRYYFSRIYPSSVVPKIKVGCICIQYGILCIYIYIFIYYIHIYGHTGPETR